VTPRRPDVGVVERRLRALADAVGDLRRLEGIDAPGLRADPIARAAAERLLQVAVDLAVDVNAHLATAVLGRAPATGRESFSLAAEAGILSRELADVLTPAAGLRNLLVHRDVDIDPELVSRAVGDVLELMPRYVDGVAGYLRSTTG
jgi:uncharacterized protein YutE (UPF0331/DUF86 family)